MAGNSASKNIYCSNSSYPYVLKVSFTETSTSTANNTSVISISGSLYNQYMSWSSNYNSFLDLYWYDNNTGKQKLVATSAGFAAYSAGSTRSVSKSITVSHKADGTLSGWAAIQFRAGSTSGGWSPPSTWLQTGSTTLSTIPRASSISSLSGSYLGSQISASISRASSSFTHKVEYSFAGSAYATIASAATNSVTWTPPVSLATRIPNSRSGTFTLRVTTFNGSTQIGSAVTRSITLNMPNGYNPVVKVNTPTRIDNGVPASWGVYVQGFSKVTISGSATGQLGASISSYRIFGDFINVSSSSGTSGVLTKSGQVRHMFEAVDSRGYSLATSVAFDVVPYSNPSINVSAFRCNSDGTASANGTHLKVTCNYSIASVSGKNSVASRSVTCNGVSNTGFSSGAAFVLAANCSIGSKYTLTATVRDALGRSATSSIEIQTAERILNVKQNKKGMGIGKFAGADGALELGWKLDPQKGIKIIDSNKDNAINVVKSSTEPLTFRVYDSYLNSGTPSSYGLVLEMVGRHSHWQPQLLFASESGGPVGIYHRDKPYNNNNFTSWKRLLYQNDNVSFVTSSYITAGSTITAGTYLNANANGKNIQIGSQNSSHCHYVTTANSHWFNKTVYVAGNVYGGTSYNRRLAYADEIPSMGNYLHLSGGTVSGAMTVYKSYFAANYIGCRYDSEWIGFYASVAGAQNNSGRKGWIGHDKTKNFTFMNEAGGTNCSNKSWTIVSDKRLKKEIEDMPDIYINIWNELTPKVFRWNELNPNLGKKEFGLIAQDVIGAFEKYDLDYKDYAFVNTIKLETAGDREKDKSKLEDEEYFSLSYDHYFMLTSQVVKKQQKEIDTLKKEVSELKDLVKQSLGKENT